MMYIARTKRDFEQYFREEVLPTTRAMFEQDRRVDVTARREAWNDTIDLLLKDGALPPRAEQWICPW